MDALVFVDVGKENKMVANNATKLNEEVKDTATRRVLRTVIQLLVAGAFTALFTQIAKDAGDKYGVYIMLISTLVVVAAQNYAESEGWISPVLGTKANVKKDTV